MGLYILYVCVFKLITNRFNCLYHHLVFSCIYLSHLYSIYNTFSKNLVLQYITMLDFVLLVPSFLLTQHTTYHPKLPQAFSPLFPIPRDSGLSPFRVVTDKSGNTLSKVHYFSTMLYNSWHILHDLKSFYNI